MVDLALADDDAPVSSIAMSVVATVDADTTAHECARLQRHYNLTQLPVVQEGRLIGVILAESLLGAVVEQGTSQMLKVASVAGRVWTTPSSPRCARAFHGSRSTLPPRFLQRRQSISLSRP